LDLSSTQKTQLSNRHQWILKVKKKRVSWKKKKTKTFKPMHSKNVPGIEFIEHLAKHKSIEHNGIMRVIGLYA